MTGMPPATAASNRRARPAASAVFGEGLAVVGEQRLVGADDVFAAGEGGLGRIFRGAFVAAHHLDEDVDVLALCQRDGVGFPRIAGQVRIAVLLRVAGGNGGDHHRATGAGGDQVGMGLHDLDHANSHSAKTGKTKAQGGARAAARRGRPARRRGRPPPAAGRPGPAGRRSARAWAAARPWPRDRRQGRAARRNPRPAPPARRPGRRRGKAGRNGGA
jgi:hypothetical protein